LIENNASVGADIAIEYSKLMKAESAIKKRRHKDDDQVSREVVANIKNVTHSGLKRPVSMYYKERNIGVN